MAESMAGESPEVAARVAASTEVGLEVVASAAVA
jgi:hypothetical protein